ncbi:hypothetical protein ACV07N_09765 [Roseivirga echinicomitans]
MKIIGWALPFILGLFASLIIDTIRDRIKNKKNKTFIKYYFQNSVLKSVSELNSDYKTIKEKIKTYASEGKSVISAHEDFNTNVLKGISSTEYYSAFKEQFVLLNEITSMISYLSQNLPDKINNDFYGFLNSHLKELGKIGDQQHVNECEACKQHKSEILRLLDSRIRETEILKEKIEKLIK